MKTELKLDYEISKKSGNSMPAIILAAGSSTRMKGKNKQMLSLGGIPVIARTLLTFNNCDIVDRIILVVRAEDLFFFQSIAEKYSISKLTDIVCGGDTRQDSVLKGFERIAENEEAVLIHDGARPLVEQDIIKSVGDALSEFSAVTCAVKVKDTIKKIDTQGKVLSTIDRESLVSVQTPQGVRVKDYLSAVSKVSSVADFTDDTSIMEAAGFEVLTVEGSYKNIKITTPEDIIMAEAFIKEEV